MTSLNNSEARTSAATEHLEHDLRYDRADEFMEVVMGHWDTWDDDALILDKAERPLRRPRQGPSRSTMTGKFFKSRGPFTVPRSPQGHPVLMQAGQSGRGRHVRRPLGRADLRRLSQPRAAGQKHYAELKAAVAAAGRDPDQVQVAPACYVDRRRDRGAGRGAARCIDGLAKPIDALVLLSEVLNFDFASKPYDEPFTDDELAALSWHRLPRPGRRAERQAQPDACATSSSSPAAARSTNSRCSAARRRWSPTRWRSGSSGACDGFVLAATHMPGAYEDFVRLVVPELQRRGLFRKDYSGATLRENLGLQRPTALDCRLAAAQPVLKEAVNG